ncbi:putative transcription factor tau55-related protein [Rosellinia necatrix]|uniref:Putative transcription factor tau55-related protein n=1 Tax=Rosellinia necatrix TaxID=77044 RepID=A0A1W2TMK4_ROSNE|nr:putative transcription factor tau55-related protein [Rosellinia necatrix]
MASPDLLDPRLRSPRITAPTLSHTHGDIKDDNESEWEYEYSTTETETFYVTLDLSKADFRAQEQIRNPPPPSRGGWQNHRASELFLNRRKAAERASHNSPASSAGSSDAERDEDALPEASHGGHDKRRSNGQDDSRANSERVQILELHSENPIISYKGRVFSGQWCENTTTELLMVRRNGKSSLPVLQHLDDGVDLLAASASRINVTEQKLKPKASDRERQRASAHLPQTVIPPVDLKASQERIDQRNFLADLIAIKRRKGETDDVTVIARSMQGKRTVTKPKGVRMHRRGRWAHTDKLHPVRGLEERPRRGGRRKGSGRARGKWALFPLEEAVRDSASIASSVADSPADGGSGISTPTPFRWDDLEEGHQGDSPARMQDIMEGDLEDEQEEDEAEFDDNDDNNDYEEDEEDDQGEMDVDEDEDDV